MSRGLRIQSRRWTALASSLICTAGALAFLVYSADSAHADSTTVSISQTTANGLTINVTAPAAVTFVPNPGANAVYSVAISVNGGSTQTLSLAKGQNHSLEVDFSIGGTYDFTWQYATLVKGPKRSGKVVVADAPPPSQTPTPPSSSTPTQPGGSDSDSSSPSSSDTGSASGSASGSGSPTGSGSVSGSGTGATPPPPITSTYGTTVITFGPTGQPIVITGFAAPGGDNSGGHGNEGPGTFPPVGDITGGVTQQAGAPIASDVPSGATLAAKSVKAPTSLAVAAIAALALVSSVSAYRLFGRREH
jgi:hypothetical protein